MPLSDRNDHPRSGYVRYEREARPMCVSFPFLPVGSFPQPPPSFCRVVPFEHSHMHMQIYSAGALVSAARRATMLCICVYTCMYLYDGTLRGACMYAYMLRRAVVQADRGGEGHKLNDVNALSTLCRYERRRHTGLPSRVHRPPDWLLPPPPPPSLVLPPPPTDSDDRCYPPCLDAGPRRLIIIIAIYTPVQLRLHARDDNERENVRTYLLYYFRNM